MSLSTSFRNIKIKDNSIDIGFSSTGAVPANYTYDSNLSIDGDAIIVNNTFKGCIGNGVGSTDLMTVVTGSSIITNNNFIRGVGSPVATYINVVSTTDQFITDNIFDQPTVDGTIDVSVTGLSTGSIYHSNKNQVIYIPIQLGMEATTDPSGNLIYSNAHSNALNNILYFKDAIFSTTTQVLSIYLNLNEALPDGVRIDELKLGIYCTNAGATLNSSAGLNQVFIRVATVDNVSANYSTGDSSILDAKAAFSTAIPTVKTDTTYNIYSNFAALQLATQYITTTINDERYRNTKDRMLTLEFSHTMKLTVAGSVGFYFSPILAKCIW